MTVSLPKVPGDSERHLDLIGLIGLMRLAVFEALGDRKFWDERFFDLILSMLAKQLRGSASTQEDMLAAIRGVSHSTKMRMFEDARKAGLIVSTPRSKVALEQPLDDASARKVFFLSEQTMDRLLSRLGEVTGDVHAFAERHGRGAAAKAQTV